ncbi:MAG: hypothetical protein IPK76_02645 [Lewinellaceae bacterium]|nr:hypothetical protein [Lewinellaceae bacterium]
MKRFVLIPLLLLFISNFIHAQNFNFGVKAGAQMVNITRLNDGKTPCSTMPAVFWKSH